MQAGIASALRLRAIRSRVEETALTILDFSGSDARFGDPHIGHCRPISLVEQDDPCGAEPNNLIEYTRFPVVKSRVSLSTSAESFGSCRADSLLDNDATDLDGQKLSPHPSF